MTKVLLVLALMTVPALGDGNGVDIIPFSTPGGVVTGTISIDQDGNATLQGQIQGVPFSGLGKSARNSDGSWDFPVILSDADMLMKQHTWIPLQLHFIGTEADSQDGDDGDDAGGTIDVKSQTGVGKGSIQLGC